MQTKLAALGLVAAAGGGTWIATAPPPGEYYDLSPSEISSRLMSASIPGDVDQQMSGNGDLVHRVYRRGQSEVVWEFSIAREPVAAITAELEPDGEGTRVAVNFDMADTELGDAAAQDLGEGHEFLGGLLELVMTEHVDATLDRRKFDEKAFAKKLAGYALTNPNAARKFMRRAQNESGASAMKARVREAIDEDAAWHKEPDRLDASGYEPEAYESDGTAPEGVEPEGFDPTPPEDGW